MPAVWREFCLPLQGQTRHSCDGQWHQSFPHQTRCHIHCPAPSGGHLCNKRRALIQENITVSYLMLQPKLQINWPISELAATSTFPPPSMKDVIVSTLMFPPKSTGGKNRKLFLIHWDNDDACNYIVDFEEKKKTWNLPSTDGAKMIKWSYTNWPYLIRDREGSSAVLNVMSKPRSEKRNTISAALKHVMHFCSNSKCCMP